MLQGGRISCEGRDDAKGYKSIRSAMDLFFSKAERLDILKLLAAILHLGNVYFEGEWTCLKTPLGYCNKKGLVLMYRMGRERGKRSTRLFCLSGDD